MELDYTYNPLRAELLREPVEFRNGCLCLPGGPGLGIDIAPDAFEKFAFSGAEELAVRQKTLSAV
jgi:D-galactarolactone cycloisomerase